MEEQPRSQSALQTRAPVVQSRASKIIQRVSNLKSRIRLPGRKFKDDREISNPYPSQSRSMDGFGSTKPYMSQPILGLSNMIVEPFNPTNRDYGGSYSQSMQPAHVLPGNESRRRMTRTSSPAPASSLSLAIPRRPISPVLRHGLQPGGGVINSRRDIDGLPKVSGSQIHPPSNDIQPHTITEVPALKPGSELGIIPSRTSSVSQTHLVEWPRSSPGAQTSTSKNGPSNTNLVASSPTQQRDTQHTPSHVSSFDSPQVLSTSISSPMPMSVSTSSARTYGPSAAPSTSTPALRISTAPDRRHIAPRLTLPPPNYRFSLSMVDGSPGRLSPSVILRPPPLPILHLPPLPTFPAPDPSSTTTGNREERAGLRSMPELPHRGTERADDGDDREGDEDGDEDEDDEDEDEDEGRPREALQAGNNDMRLNLDDNENYSRPSMSSSIENGGVFPSQSSQSISHSRSSSYQLDVVPLLPLVDTSRLEFPFLDDPPPSNIRGKGKARSGENGFDDSDTTRTPTSVSSHRDYFNVKARSVEGDTPHPRKHSVSPLRTPRPGDASLMVLPLPPIRTPDLLSALPPPHLRRPGIHKHASRSLIDIHTIEKKEEVEKMVRAEEEAFINNEKRMSMLGRNSTIKGKERETALWTTGEESSQTVDAGQETNESMLQKRASNIPAYDAISHPLRRRRSMPMFTEASLPPPYPSFAPYALPMSASVKIQPRDDEGKERLPPYANGIYVKSIVPRKMEFLSAGVQAKDRKWRRVMCVLEGTALKIYRCPAGATGVSAIGEWWERKVGVGDVSAPPAVAGGTENPSASGDSGGNVNGIPKLGETRGNEQTELRVTPQSQPSSPLSPIQPPPPPASRSRLNLAIHLLKPSRPHGRSNSDVSNNPPRPPSSPRPSLNIPRSSRGARSSSNSRSVSRGSPSPTTAPSSASDHSLTISIPSSSSSQLFHSTQPDPNTSSSSRSHFRPGGSSSGGALPDPDPADLIKAYTMQHAESGLGNDYIKRRNVIRVRVEGEQFLLQAKDVTDVVEWIEALQAAANIALDLDERPMPKGPLFPRRRRRRGARRPDTAAGNMQASAYISTTDPPSAVPM